MQVSNGTGQGSEYRVGTNSGGNMLQNSSAQKTAETMGYIGGRLEPGGSARCSIEESVYIEFWIGREMVASASFPKDPGQVTLVEKDCGFSIAVTGAASVAA
jgi:hypothetical protein